MAEREPLTVESDPHLSTLAARAAVPVAGEDPGEAADAYLRGLVSIATPGEWYVWADEDERLVQLMSRTHGSITGRIPLSPQTRGDLMAAAAAVNLIREGRT
jgi:hypothetical protein